MAPLLSSTALCELGGLVEFSCCHSLIETTVSLYLCLRLFLTGLSFPCDFFTSAWPDCVTIPIALVGSERRRGMREKGKRWWNKNRKRRKTNCPVATVVLLLLAFFCVCSFFSNPIWFLLFLRSFFSVWSRHDHLLREEGRQVFSLTATLVRYSLNWQIAH